VYGFRRCDEPPHLFGGFAEFVRVQPRSFLFLVPDDLPDELAVLTEPTAVALRAVERAMAPGLPLIGEGLSVGRTALVVGVGPIGLLIVAVLKGMGLHRVLAADLNSFRLEQAAALGADETVLVSPSSEDALSSIRDATDGEGADVVFECAGVPSAFEFALQAVCRGGTVIELGHFTDSGTVPLSPHLLCFKDVDIRGVWAYPWWQFRDALRFLSTTSLSLAPLITHHLSLEQVGGILREPTPEMLKPVIRW
jgi:L-iditol 2-dehydrogenase